MNRVIILLGPTGVGKTKTSILLAKALNTEIISADSMQIYRHMDIGTAKPSAKELREVHHHLIDVLLPEESFSAGIFREMALRIIEDLHKQGRIPVIVGGTGLYISSLTRGLFEGPSADWEIREKYNEEARLHGNEHIYGLLEKVDPEAAAKITHGDTRRIIRALEVAAGNERTITEYQKTLTEPADYDYLKIGLMRDRKELYGIIEDRVDRMINEGLLEETRNLLRMNPGRTSLQAIGYKEMKLNLDGDIGFEEAVRLIKKRTKMYAKRQHTWFKKEPDINWVDISGIAEADKIYKKVINDVKMLDKFCGLT